MDIYETLTPLKDNPEQFQMVVDEIFEKYYTTIPPERLELAKKFQWQIDTKLQHYKDPIARMNKMVELFWEGFNKFQNALNEDAVKEQPQSTGKILSFTDRKK